MHEGIHPTNYNIALRFQTDRVRHVFIPRGSFQTHDRDVGTSKQLIVLETLV